MSVLGEIVDFNAALVGQLRNGVGLDPDYWFTHYFLGRAYEQKGRLPECHR